MRSVSLKGEHNARGHLNARRLACTRLPPSFARPRIVMKSASSDRKTLLCLFMTLTVCLSVPEAAFGQTEKLGIVNYTPPRGWTKTPKENVIAFSEINQTTGRFCIITLYGATPGTGNPDSDFTREWNNLVVRTMKAQANPRTDAQASDGWTATSAGSEAESGAGKALAFLTVISGFGKTVSVLAVFNDPAYAKQVDALVMSQT